MVHAALDAVRRKQLILTVTAGRTGTLYLANLLGLAPGVASYHEPDPSYRQLMRAAIDDPGVARAFFLNLKLPAIASAPRPIYAETSHLFCKGFFIPLLQLGVRPGLIFLRRAPREVALSFLARETVPTRTPLGDAYTFRPDDENVLPIARWQKLTDYQLCFWYAVAIERRQWRYAEFARMLGLRAYDTTADELNDFANYRTMLEGFGLTCGAQLEAAHKRISAMRHNTNPVRQVAFGDFDAQEAEVWDRVAPIEPLLEQVVTARYGLPARKTPRHIRAA